MACRLIPAVKQAQQRQQKLLKRQKESVHAKVSSSFSAQHHPKPKAAQVCSSKRPLQLCDTCRTPLNSFVIPHAGFSCDRCDCQIQEGSTVLSCRRCDYDLCRRCQQSPSPQGTHQSISPLAPKPTAHRAEPHAMSVCTSKGPTYELPARNSSLL